jgi:ABC-type multidrug transport system ATPase subunit
MRGFLGLCKKNALLILRQPKSSIAEVVVPVYVIWYAWLFKVTFPDSSNEDLDIPAAAKDVLDEFGFVPPEHLAAITKVEGSARFKAAMAYAQIGNYTLEPQIVVSEEGLSYNQTLSKGLAVPYKNANDAWDVAYVRTPPDWTWDMQYLVNGLGYLQSAAMRASVALEDGSPPMLANWWVEPMPEVEGKEKPCKGAGCVTKWVWPAIFTSATFMTLQNIVMEIGHEKEVMLVQKLLDSGMRRSSYWFSWFCTRGLFTCIPALASVMSMWGFGLVEHSSPTLIFVTFQLFNLSCLAFACTIAASANSTKAMLGIFITMISIIPMTYYAVEIFLIAERASTASVNATFLISFNALGHFIFELAKAEAAGVGLTWANVWGRSAYMPGAYQMMLLDVVGWMLLALYLDFVLPKPGGIGSAEKPFFFLKPDFWFRSVTAAELGEGVEIQDVSKVFNVADATGKGKKELFAVNGVTLSIKTGEIVGLLGHNGAGKTTLISAITGKIVPTSGDIVIGGYNTRTDMRRINASGAIGMVPQFDTLFPSLTAREHMEVFAAVRGLSPSDPQPTELLEAVDLLTTPNVASKYSGGMRRRLSIALSLLGDPKVLVLDEPTTGIDPVNRRRVWDLFNKYRKTAVMLLTTHSMEEADLLSDRIAIMSKGAVVGCGTARELKVAHGCGYILHVYRKDAAAPSAPLIDICKRHVPAAIVLTDVGAELAVGVPLADAAAFPKLLPELGADASVSSFATSLSTLEEVFMKLGEEATDEEAALLGETVEVLDEIELRRALEASALLSSAESEGSNPSSLFSKCGEELTVTAVFPGVVVCGETRLPSAGVRIKEKGTGSKAKQREKEAQRKAELIAFTPPPHTMPTSAQQFAAVADVVTKNSLRDPILNFTLIGQPIFMALLCWYFRGWFQPGLRTFSTQGAPACSQRPREDCNWLPDWACPHPDADCNWLLYDWKLYWSDDYSSWSDGYFGLDAVLPEHVAFACDVPSALKMQCQAMMKQEWNATEYETAKALDDALKKRDQVTGPQVAFEVRGLTAAELGMEASGQAAVDALFSDSLLTSPVAIRIRADLKVTKASIASLDLITRELAAASSGTVVAAPGTFAYTETDKGPAAKGHASDLDSGGLIYVFAISLALIPSVPCVEMVQQRTEGQKDLLLVAGLPLRLYWVGQAVAHMLLMLASLACCALVFWGSQLWDQWSDQAVGFPMSIPGMFLVFFCAIPGLTVQGYLVSFIFEEYLNAVEWTQELFQIIVSGPFIIMTFGNPTAELSAHAMLSVIPGYGAFYALALLQTSGNEGRGLQGAFDDGLGQICAVLLLSAIAMSVLLFLIEQVKFWHAKSVEGKAQAAEKVETVHPELNSAGIVARDIAKRYRVNGQDVWANKGISMTVDPGMVYCLLGPNGAGKTTFHSILTTLIPPTSGWGQLNGFSLGNPKARYQMGVCTQFDRLFGMLTPVEMLTVMAQLRGVPVQVAKDAAEAAVLGVGLWQKRAAQASTLSGGQKRKLSFAMALIGKPPVVFMDEPTTGMDTNTRRDVWVYMRRECGGRAVVLTTHSMEEAEALASKIGIVVNGVMRVEGSKEELKAQCAVGLHLTVVSPTGRAPMDEAIAEIFPGAARSAASANATHVYEVSTDDVPLAQKFEAIEARKHALAISEYTITQTTMDNVFYRFAMEQGGEASSTDVKTSSTKGAAIKDSTHELQTENEIEV